MNRIQVHCKKIFNFAPRLKLFGINPTFSVIGHEKPFRRLRVGVLLKIAALRGVSRRRVERGRIGTGIRDYGTESPPVAKTRDPSQRTRLVPVECDSPATALSRAHVFVAKNHPVLTSVAPSFSALISLHVNLNYFVVFLKLSGVFCKF